MGAVDPCAEQAMSPTELTLRHLRRAGYLAEVTERWIPMARKRKDLFGVVDVLALQGPQTLAVQTTSASNVSARVQKIADSDCVRFIRAAGWTLVVHGWRKGKDGKYQLRIVDCS